MTPILHNVILTLLSGVTLSRLMRVINQLSTHAPNCQRLTPVQRACS